MSTSQRYPFPEHLWCTGVAAILPCYWVYQHVGQRLKQHGSPNKHYQAWIDTYGGEGFDSTVEQAKAVMEEVAATLTESQRTRCFEHFQTCCRLEYMFFDGPHRGETWPC